MDSWPPSPRSFFSFASRPPLLHRHDIVSARVARTLDGVRIGQLSDIHVRAGVKPRRLHQAVELLNQLKPDLVALTGDYVCLSAKPLPELTRALRQLTVPAFATLGNHDHWSGALKVRRALEAAGVQVLSNEHRALKLGQGTLHVVGVDDAITHNHDPERAFEGVPAEATTVALSHDPNSADLLCRWQPALILSGHTHGGQVFIQRLTPFMARRVGIKYLHGFFDVQGSVLYVNRGLGASVPVRFRSPMEVAHLTLRSTGKAPASACAQ